MKILQFASNLERPNGDLAEDWIHQRPNRRKERQLSRFLFSVLLKCVASRTSRQESEITDVVLTEKIRRNLPQINP